MSMETQDIIKRSATNAITPPPQARDYKAEVCARNLSTAPVTGRW